MFAITERLLLRPGWAEDAPSLARAIGDEAVVRTLARVPRPYALDDAERYLAMPHDPLRPRFLIRRRDDGGLVGGVGIHDGGGEDPELGYWIAHDLWGRGYATEACRAVVALADWSLRLPRLIAHHALDNPASGAVLRKLGFQPGPIGRVHSPVRDETIEVRQFARRRDAGDPATAPLAA